MIYLYGCKNCKHEFETEQRITAEPLRDCPECGSKDSLQRLIGKTNFILKGKGWYKDGY